MRLLLWSKKYINMMTIAVILLISTLSAGPIPRAQAGVWDWVTGISEVPSEVDELKSQYTKMEQSLVETQQRYEEMTSKLNAENEALRTQNEQLQARLLQLEEQDQKQKQQRNRILNTVLTAVGLLIGYFLLTRVLRVLVWRRHSRS